MGILACWRVNICVLASLLSVGCASHRNSGAETAGRRAAAMVRDLRWTGVKTNYLLALVSFTVDRSTGIEEGLLALELTSHNWTLVHAVRQPHASQLRGRHWKVYVAYDIPHSSTRDFAERPTKVEIEKFLKDTNWPYPNHAGFHDYRSEVYKQEWQSAFGFSPPY